MQTGIFYVKLNEKLLEAIEKSNYQGDEPLDLILNYIEIFTKSKTYPVLAIDRTTIINREGKITGEKTFYHIPMDNNVLEWISSEIFQFVGLIETKTNSTNV